LLGFIFVAELKYLKTFSDLDRGEPQLRAVQLVHVIKDHPSRGLLQPQPWEGHVLQSQHHLGRILAVGHVWWQALCRCLRSAR